MSATAEALASISAIGGGDGQLTRLTGLLDEPFLAEAGWDADRFVLSLPQNHPLLGRPICRAPGCEFTARGPTRLCRGCQTRLAKRGLGDNDINAIPRGRRPPGRCVVAGCERDWGSSRSRLCRAHHRQQRRLGVSVEAFLTHPVVARLPDCGPCLVAACTRSRRTPCGSYCNAHAQRWRAVLSRDPEADEQQWRLTVPASKEPGRVSLRGLSPLVVAQVLYGMQERIRSGRKLNDTRLNAVCDALRRQQLDNIADVDTTALSISTRALVNNFGASRPLGVAGPGNRKD